MTKKTYTAQLAQAKAMMVQDMPVHTIARKCNLAPITIIRYRNRWKEEISEAKKEIIVGAMKRAKIDHEKVLAEVADNLAGAVQRISSKFTPEFVEKIPASYLSTTLGTLIDKLRLLRGEATSIHEQRFAGRVDMLHYLREGGNASTEGAGSTVIEAKIVDKSMGCLPAESANNNVAKPHVPQTGKHRRRKQGAGADNK